MIATDVDTNIEIEALTTGTTKIVVNATFARYATYLIRSHRARLLSWQKSLCSAIAVAATVILVQLPTRGSDSPIAATA